MKNNKEEVVKFLKELIYKNGEDYLSREPYEVYKKIIESKVVEKCVAASFIHLLLCVSLKDIVNNEKEDISKIIQKECFFNKKISDYLSGIILSLYSKDNKNELENNELVGFKSFLSEDFIYKWNGYSIWEYNNVICRSYFNAEIILKPTEKIKEENTIKLELKKNCFLTKEYIYNYFVKKLKLYLDNDFEEYCNCDDYYPPVAEDYYENLEGTIESWCEKNGFEFKSCEGEGETGDYEQKSKYIKYK